MVAIPSGWEGVSFMMEAVTFVQFIHEEALQACGLACFMALRAKNYKAASWAIQTMRTPLLEHLKNQNSIAGWLAPYSKGCFEDYITATELQIQVYDELLIQARG
jgi:hypothetical protein